MKHKLSYFIILLGVLVMIYPFASNLYSSFWEDRMLQEAEEMLGEIEPDSGEEEFSEEVSDSFTRMNQAFDEAESEEESVDPEAVDDESVDPEAVDDESVEPDSETAEEESLQTESEDPGEEDPESEPAAENEEVSGEIADNAPERISSTSEVAHSGEAIDFNKPGRVIGTIRIPSINVNLPLLFGSDNRTLDRGAGQIIGTAAPGEIGNTGIAAHRANRDGRFFYRLDEVGVGDTIIIETSSGTFTYEVYDTKIVDPRDLSVLNRNQRDRIVTLITCHPRYTADYRLIVHGKLVSSNN